MLRLMMLESYEEAELVAARIGASKMSFFKPKAPDEYTGPRRRTTQPRNGSIPRPIRDPACRLRISDL